MKRIHKKIRRAEILLICCGLILMLAGFIFDKKPVELLNEDPPLIDLDQAIQEAKFGQNGNREATQEEELSGKVAEHTITVRDEAIKYDGKICPTIEHLKKRIMGNPKEELLHLEDDYAEAHCYRAVLELLEELKGNGYRYAERYPDSGKK